jgi:hypothetical protein
VDREMPVVEGEGDRVVLHRVLDADPVAPAAAETERRVGRARECRIARRAIVIVIVRF